eukprot:109245_1
MVKLKFKTQRTAYSCPFGGKKLSEDEWIHQHPGGYDNLRSAYEVETNAANILFLSYHTGHNLNKCNSIAQKYDYLVPQQTSMHKQLNKIFLNVQKKYWIHGVINQVYCLMLTFMICLCFFWQLLYPSFISRFTYGFFQLSFSFAIFHTMNHCGKLYDNKMIDNFFKPIYEFYSNVETMWQSSRWIDVHHKSHHIYTNSDEDPDVAGGYPILNLWKYFKVLPYHKYQYIYQPFLSMLFTSKTLDGVFRQIVPINNITKEKTGHWKYILLNIFVHYIIPFFVHDYSFYSIYLHLLSNMFYGMLLGLLFLVSHNQNSLAHFQYGDDNIINNYDKWVTHQIESAMSYNTHNTMFNYFFTLICGGINFQIEHHIAPAIFPIYYYFAANEIQTFCKKNSIEYTKKNKFIDAVVDFQKYLYQIGKNKD